MTCTADLHLTQAQRDAPAASPRSMSLRVMLETRFSLALMALGTCASSIPGPEAKRKIDASAGECTPILARFFMMQRGPPRANP